MSKKIIGVTVGTPLRPQKIKEKAKICWDDLQDKPFEEGEKIVCYDNPSLYIGDYGEYFEEIEQDFLIPGKEYEVELEGAIHYVTCFAAFDDTNRLNGGTFMLSVIRLLNGTYEMLLSCGQYEYATISFKVSQVAEVKTLDSKYLPMEEIVDAVTEALPEPDVDVDLTGYATEQYVREYAQPKGNYLTAHQSLEGYAKTEDIPTKPEDIGAQPAGNYALKSEIPSVPVKSVNGKTGNVQLSASDVGALPSSYTPPNQTAEQVGADPKGTAASAVSQHNTADDSHNDIRLELKAINDRLTAFFDSDDKTLDELSEIVAYITSNKALIDSITTSKVSVGDIINNLTTNVANKPLSSAQGVVLKGLIDSVSNSLSNYALKSAIPAKVSQLQNDSGYLTEHQDISGKLDASALPTAINTALALAQASGEFDGKTPVKGEDYYTEADKTEMVNAVIKALPVYNGEVV